MRRLVVQSSLKICDGNNNKADFQDDNMKIKMIETRTNAKEETSIIFWQRGNNSGHNKEVEHIAKT